MAENNRRNFVKAMAASSIIGMMPFGVINSSLATSALTPSSPSEPKFTLSVRGNLVDPPIDLEVGLRSLSDALNLMDKGIYKGTYRFKVSPGPINEHYGPSFKLDLLDTSGNLLDSMNIGNNTTATFNRFGVQVYLLSLDYPR